MPLPRSGSRHAHPRGKRRQIVLHERILLRFRNHQIVLAQEHTQRGFVAVNLRDCVPSTYPDRITAEEVNRVAPQGDGVSIYRDTRRQLQLAILFTNLQRCLGHPFAHAKPLLERSSERAPVDKGARQKRECRCQASVGGDPAPALVEQNPHCRNVGRLSNNPRQAACGQR